ncbi:MAG TPA: efflux RND transporter permease subunit [Kofleriaceae bacterium]|nr:efflux RND transporter permease subunit [Kofleriaceae bacterium]
MTGLSLRNPIAVAMACIAFIVFAAVVTPRMAVDTFPELTPPVLVIGTLAPGLGAKDVEKTLNWRFEKYVSATPGVDHVESVSRNNLSLVFVWLKWGTDLGSSQTLVQQQVSFAMSAVPKSLGILPPFVLQFDPAALAVIQVAVYGGGMTGPQIYDYAQNAVEPLLEGISGVASASVNGGRQRQINVVVDPTKAQARGVTSSDVAAAVRDSNALLPAGELINPQFDAIVYTNAIPRRIRDIGDAIVKLAGGKPVRISDVATVVDGASPQTQAVTINGTDAVYLNVLRVPGGNTIEIVDQVRAVIAHLQGLPPGLHVEPIFDQSTFVRGTYHGLKKEIVQAVILVALVILLFLQSLRGTLVVSLAIPLSFAITLIVLYAKGQTLNAFTLGGLTLVMGRLVDDAVVVLESIHRFRKRGMSVADAALHGTRAVALAVLASTLTTMAVLLPVLLFAGLAQRLFVPLALTVAVAMAASYFVSIAVTPVMCRYLLGDAEPGRIARRFERGIERLAHGYVRALETLIPHGATVLVTAAVLVGASAWAAARLPSTFFPDIDESMERIYIRLPPGTSLEDSSKRIQEMAEALRKSLPDGMVKLALTNVGSPKAARSAMANPNWGPHMGFIRLALTDPDDRELSQQDIADRLRKTLQDRYPGVEFQQAPGGLVATVFSNGYRTPLAVEVRGDNLDQLSARATAVAEVARTIPGIRDVYPTLQLDYPEVRINTDREEAGAVGVTARDAAQITLESTMGNINTPAVWVDDSNGQSYYVVTGYDPRRLSDPGTLAAAPVRIDRRGAAVTLGAYGAITRSTGPIAIERNQLQRAAHVLMQVEGRDIGSAAAELEDRLAHDPRTASLEVHFVGQVDLMRTTFSGLGLAIGLAVMVVFMIMASQFKSLKLPFIMLFTIPCTLIGIVIALMAGHQGFSVTALMGVLMVVGIAVSNGILLIDHARVRLDDGLLPYDAIVDAARTRFVPIAMTSLATVIGLIPTAFALDRGADANQPLALAVVGGLTSSTILSLFVVPVIFLALVRHKPAAPPPPPAAEVAEPVP